MSIYKTSKSKENILRKIRQSLQDYKSPIPYPETEKVDICSVFSPNEGLSSEELFAREFTNAGGHFVFCEDAEEMIVALNTIAETRGWREVFCAHKQLFSFFVNNKLSFIREFNVRHEHADACITDCEVAIARTGSFLLTSKQNFGRIAPIYFPVHIVVIQAHHIVPDIADALHLIQQKHAGNMPSMINVSTGPSRTADIEKTLVTGVHGPKEVLCFFLNQ